MKKIIIIWFVIILIFASCISEVDNTNKVNTIQDENSQTTQEDLFQILENKDNWQNINFENSFSYNQTIKTKGFNNVLKITSDGLVRNNLMHLYVDNEYIFVSGDWGGYSYFNLNNISENKKEINNVIISSDNMYSGHTEFAKYKDKIYARYGNYILDAFEGKILYENLPSPTMNIRGISPKDRFLIDLEGNFWIGASELSDDSPEKNGLYKISSDFKTKNKILSEAIWQIYMDSNKDIWVISKKGIYKFDHENNYTSHLLFDYENTKLWGEHLIEYDNTIYFIAKNYFDTDEILNNNDEEKEYFLFKFDKNMKYKEIINITQWLKDFKNSSYIFQADMNLFVFNNELYIVRRGTSEVLKYIEQTNDFEVANFGYYVGQLSIKTISMEDHDVLVSVGGIPGIAFYNFNNNSDFNIITQAMTSNGLISNDIYNMFNDQINNKIYLSHHTGAYTIIDSNGKITGKSIYTGDIKDLNIEMTGFFYHNNNLYISANSEIFKKESEDIWEKCQYFFKTNLEKIYYHNGNLWSIITFGGMPENSGNIGYLNFETGKVWSNNSSIYYNDIENKIPISNKNYIYDIIDIDEDNLFIAVGTTFWNKDTTIDYIYKYTYSSNSVEKMDLPDESSKGLFKLTKDASGNIYGISHKKIYRYNGLSKKWENFMDMDIGANKDLDAIIIGNFMFIINSSDTMYNTAKYHCIDIINLNSKEHKCIDGSEIDIPRTISSIAYINNKDQNLTHLWLGSRDGLSHIKIPLSKFSESK